MKMWQKAHLQFCEAETEAGVWRFRICDTAFVVSLWRMFHLQTFEAAVDGGHDHLGHQSWKIRR